MITGGKSMKKKYTKPEVLFEHMEFNTAIASACDWQAVTDCIDADPTNEYFDAPISVKDPEDPGSVMVLIANGIDGCRTSQTCYHVPVLSESVKAVLS